MRPASRLATFQEAFGWTHLAWFYAPGNTNIKRIRGKPNYCQQVSNERGQLPLGERLGRGLRRVFRQKVDFFSDTF